MAEQTHNASPAITDQPIPGPEAHAAHHGDTTTILGRTLPFPIYTVIFGILAVVTLVEVIISELPEGIVGNALLIGLSGIKAALVVWYYMHLREDGPLYTLILVVPVILVVIATWFLTSVPLGNY